MVKKYLFSLLFLIILSGAALPAYAKYNNDTVEVDIEDLYELGVFNRSFYTIEIFNNPQVSESKFTLRFASFGEISGCADMSESELTQKQVVDSIRLEITDSEIILNDEAPRYSNYDCKVKYNKSFFDVELDRDQLIKRKIKKIELKSTEYGRFLTSNINVTKHKVELSIEKSYSNFMKTFWFLPKNAVVLHAPQAKIGQDVQALIKKFGASQSLIPMEKAYDKFELPYDANSYALFTNPSGHITKQLHSIGDNVVVGRITPTRTIYGANGSVEEPYSLEIYATLPGKKSLDLNVED